MKKIDNPLNVKFISEEELENAYFKKHIDPLMYRLWFDENKPEKEIWDDIIAHEKE